MKRKQEKLRAALWILAAFLAVLTACAQEPAPAQDRQLLEATFPPSLLMGKTAQQLEEEFQSDQESAADMNPAQWEQTAYWSDLKANEDGSVSYFFTQEQFQRMKERYYTAGAQPDFLNIDPQIIQRIEYGEADENGIPWEMTLWAEGQAVEQNEVFTQFLFSVYPSLLGRYQIMCGVPADQWQVRTVVKDGETEEIIWEGTFPQQEEEGA